MTERFVVPSRLRLTGLLFLAIGLLTILAGVFVLFMNNHDNEALHHAGQTRFWLVLLHNGVFFTLICLASVFIQAAASLAQGGWIVAWKRVPEAIGANVWIIGGVTAIILLLITFTFNQHGHNPIYHWVHPDDEVLKHKSPFLNPYMFAGFTLAAVGLWGYFGRKFRAMSLLQERAPQHSTRIYWKMVTISGLFMIVYALTQMSTIPWMWIMSIDAHWYSTMFSWYTFASAFVSGMSLILLWVVYLKNQGHLNLVNREHIHDLGKLQFAFSIFWTYVWFAQYMLIWYGNIPEETTYFKMRQQGPYSVIWYATFLINFVMPILILMARPSKRNYFTVTFMALIIIFGHWLDFYIMTMPGPLAEHWSLGWYEIGVFLGFAGLVITTVSRTLASADLIPQNHPLLKEAVLHQS